MSSSWPTPQNPQQYAGSAPASGAPVDAFGSPAEYHGAPRPHAAQLAYGYPGASQYPAPSGYSAARKSGTNGFAIAALVFGIIGGTLLAIVFGHVALSQIKKTGQDGEGMATFGLVLGYLWLVIELMMFINAFSDALHTPTY